MMHETPPLQFLIIDDGSDDQRRLFRSLRKGFPAAALHVVTSKQDFDAALAQSVFDVVVTAYQLEWSDGLKVLKRIRRRFPHVPVFWVSSGQLDEAIVAGMKAGLNDCVSKKRLQRLPKAIRDSLAQARVIREDAQVLQSLREAEQRYRAISDLTSDYAYLLHIEADGGVVCDCVNERFNYIT